MGQSLDSEGLDVYTSVSLDEVEASRDGLSIHALVVDSDSRNLDVEDVVSVVRRVTPNVLVFVVGSNPNVDLLRRLISLGIHEFCDKAQPVAGLAHTVKRACDRALVTRLSANVSHQLKATQASLSRDQADLQEQLIDSNQQLQDVNSRLQRAVAEIRTLYHMARDLAENENWSDALDRFLMALVNFLDANGAALLLYSSEAEVLAARSTFQMDGARLDDSCDTILKQRELHPRISEIHCYEDYLERRYSSCLERSASWDVTVIPLKHRQQELGFLLLDKGYASGVYFRDDYDFLSTLQTIFAEEIANAKYISELRQLTRFNKKVLDNISSGVITTDLDGRVLYANQHARHLCAQLNGRTAVRFDEIFTHPSGELWARLIASDKASQVHEVTCAADALTFPARLRTAVMHDDNLNGKVLVGIFDDLTEQRRMETEIRRNDRLRALGQLSAGVAHEIRNPLTGIANCAEVLSGKLKGDPDKARYLHAIRDEVHRLDGIIRNLLSFARPPKPNSDRCQLSDVTNRVYTLLHDQAQKKGVGLRQEVGDHPLWAFADVNQLTQVVLNMAINAVQACEPGDNVTLSIHPGGASASTVAIDVIDSGPGIPEEIRESLFEPFVTTKTQGTGLGLAISQQIVDDHQGRIHCEFLDKGTRFSIELPRLADPE